MAGVDIVQQDFELFPAKQQLVDDDGHLPPLGHYISMMFHLVHPCHDESQLTQYLSGHCQSYSVYIAVCKSLSLLWHASPQLA